MKFYNLFLFVIIVFFYSCDEIPTPIPDPVEVPEGRVIMVEDLTGTSCTPCAAAAALLNDIIDNADGAVVAYGVHGINQSEPRSNSKYDFRNPDAAELELYLQEFGKPAASVNRTESNTGSLVYGQVATWQAAIDQELAKPTVAVIEIMSIYNETNRRIDIDIKVESLEDISGPVNLVVAISESNLIDPQAAPGEDIIDFNHKHVLKELLTPILGTPIANSGLMINDPVDALFSYTIPDELNGEWIPENMEITAFITADDRDGEILQAAQIHLTE